MINLVFSPGFPLTNFEQHQYLAKCIAIIILQTAYVMYIVFAKPHSQGIYNYLEIWNEGLIILMCYIMLIYTGMGSREHSLDILKRLTPQFLSLLVTLLIVCANVGVLIRMTIVKLKQKKAEKRREKERKVRAILRGRIKKFRLTDLPIEHRLRPLSLIPIPELPETCYKSERLETYSDHSSDEDMAAKLAMRDRFLNSGNYVMPNRTRIQFQ